MVGRPHEPILLLPMDVLSMFSLLFMVFGLILFGLYIASIIWAARDAKRRGKEPLLVVLLVALVPFPFGLIIWLVIRPD